MDFFLSCPQCERPMEFSIGTVQQVKCDSCLDAWSCQIQSEETILAPAVQEMAMTESETTAFVDSATGSNIGYPSIASSIDTADAVTSAGLKEFLSRPVRILNFTWSQADAVGISQTISPWNLFFNNANIKFKLNNFSFLRANLKVKFVINASPFLYGSMRACYQPLPNFKQSTIISGTAGGQANSELIPYSQQPGVWLKPQASEGAEMTLPFFYPRAYLKAQVAQDFTDMGTLRMIIYNVLRSANGATGNSVSVQVYAWAEDVVLAGPSVGLAMQADEYGTGPVSGPASTVATIANKLKSIPFIGKFATATEMGASAVAGIAKLFGFTNVPVIDPTLPYRPSPFPQFASPEIGYPVEKLTLDAKNELSIDPSIIGLTGEDELAISKFAGRQSFLTSSSWTTATAVDTALFTAKVTPSMNLGGTVVQSLVQQTPMSLVAQLFKSWRGDIIFTFRFIATPFHKGRVRISYDPFNASVQSTADTGPVTFNKIVDLGEETEVDVRIPYQQALAWCYTYNDYVSSRYTTSTGPALTYADTFDNGMISVKVLTLLTAPVTSSTVEMQVFVRAAENIEFANPCRAPQNETVFAIQSEEYQEERVGQEMSVGTNSATIESHRSRVNFGEVVGSLRTLLRRVNLIDGIIPTITTAQAGYWKYRHMRFPPYFGYDPAGLQTVNGVNAPASTFPFNAVVVTPWHLIANCFVAVRGSIHWHYNWDGPDYVTVKAARDNDPFTTTFFGTTTWVPGSTSFNTNNIATNNPNTACGQAVVNQKTQAGLSVSVPNYSVFKFESTDPTNATAPVTSGGKYDGSCFETIVASVNKNAGVDLSDGVFERYMGIGTDLGLYFFLNCASTRILAHNSYAIP